MAVRRQLSLSPPHRRQWLRSLLAPVLAPALLCAAVLGPAPATTATEQPAVALLSATDIGPDDLTDAHARFVTLWTQRFQSGEAFQAYLDSDLVYDDGFNEAPRQEQTYLVRRLVDHWMATVPGFREHLYNPDDPDSHEDPYGERPTLAQVGAIVNAIIFHKEEFKKSLRAAEDTYDEGDGVPQVPAADSPSDGLAESAAEELRAALAQVAQVVGSTVGEVSPENTVGVVRDRLTAAVPPEALHRVPSSGDVAGVDLGQVGELVGGLVGGLLGPIGDSAGGVTGGTTEGTPGPSAGGAKAAALGTDNLVYRICWQLAAAAPTCPSTTYLVGVAAAGTTVPGQFAGVDVDGNLATGNVGNDIELGVTVDPAATLGGIGVAVTVRRHGAVAQNAKAWVRYLLPDSDKEAALGFDGRTATLQSQQVASVLFEDLAAMSAGEVRVRAGVSHTGGNGVPTVTLLTEVATASLPTGDQFAASTAIVRAPSSLTVALVTKRATSSAQTRVQVLHSAAAPDVVVTATARLAGALISGSLAFTGVPNDTVVAVTSNDATSSTHVGYTSSGQLGRIQGAVQVTPNPSAPGDRYAGSLNVARLPRTMTFQTDRTQFTYTADSSIGAGAGLALEASVTEWAANAVRRSAYVGVSNTPVALTVSLTPGSQRLVVDSGTTRVNSVHAGVVDTTQRLSLNAQVVGFPSHAELTLPTSADPRIAWSANAATTRVLAAAAYGPWTATLDVQNVPTSIAYVPGTAHLDIASSAPTTITATLSNTGVVPAVADPTANYALVERTVLVAPRTSNGATITTDLQAAVRLNSLTKVVVRPEATGTYVEARAGGGAPLHLRYLSRDNKSNRVVRGEAVLTNFPGVVTATLGPTTTISANANTTLDAFFEHGPLGVAVPAAGHGLLVRRTATPSGPHLGGRLRLTGLPTSLTIGTGSFSMTNYRPADPSLTVDVALLDNPAAPVVARVSLGGFAAGVGQNVSATWSTGAVPGGYRTVVEVSTTGPTLGALRVDAQYATHGAWLVTSALPARMSVTVSEAEGATTVSYNASAPVASVSFGGQSRSSAATAYSARAAVTLTDVPSWFTVRVGRDPSGSGPVMSYDSDGSRALDVTITADGRLRTASTAVGANLYFSVRDLARTVNVTRNGAGFALDGSGRTGQVVVRVSARARYERSGSGTANRGGWVRFPWSYRIALSAMLDNLNVVLDNVARLTVSPDLVSGVSGDFGRFHVRWDRFGVDVSAEGSVSAELNLAIGRPRFQIVSASLRTAFNVNPAFRLYAPGWRDYFWARAALGCWALDFGVRVQPQPIGTATLTGGIDLWGTAGVHRDFWLTPVLFGWTMLSDAVTGITRYDSNFYDAWWSSRWTCWWFW